MLVENEVIQGEYPGGYNARTSLQIGLAALLNPRPLTDRWYDFEVTLIGVLLAAAVIAALYLGFVIATAPDVARSGLLVRKAAETSSLAP